ncbi:MAG: hypothetical protein L3J82_03060 [Planctomycetes bacterium]|nr:hypothetical protein [Planctomycetota bacterium]
MPSDRARLRNNRILRDLSDTRARKLLALKNAIKQGSFDVETRLDMTADYMFEEVARLRAAE